MNPWDYELRWIRHCGVWLAARVFSCGKAPADAIKIPCVDIQILETVTDQEYFRLKLAGKLKYQIRRYNVDQILKVE